MHCIKFTYWVINCYATVRQTYACALFHEKERKLTNISLNIKYRLELEGPMQNSSSFRGSSHLNYSLSSSILISEIIINLYTVMELIILLISLKNYRYLT